MTRLAYAVLGATALLTVAGCASVPMAPPEVDRAAKEFPAPPPGRSQVYVYRNESLGSAVRFDLTVDGFLVGSTGPKTYLLFPVTPGQHTLVSRAENADPFPMVTEAGKTYFVWQEVKMGMFSARSRLGLVEAVKGQAGVKACGLAVTTPPLGAPAAPAEATAAVVPGS
jgi:hypothetical protein